MNVVNSNVLHCFYRRKLLFAKKAFGFRLDPEIKNLPSEHLAILSPIR